VSISFSEKDATFRWRQAFEGEKMKKAFEPWVGQAVLVQVNLGRVKLSLRGTLLKDHSETLLMRPEVGSDVEIPKTSVLAIEEAGRRCTAWQRLPY
jgi:hypothetical protein